MKTEPEKQPEQAESYLPIDKCKKGFIYKLASRNLDIGVFDGEGGFIGIRTKFKDRYLFTEYHWDTNKNFGTVKPLKELGQLPEGIPIKTSLDTIDEITGRAVHFDKPIADGGRGWFFTDTNEASTSIRPIAQNNHKLFDFLDKL